jgi:hypothetical protein
MGDIFSAIAILLVFATVALDLFVKEAQAFIKKSKPDKSKTTEIEIFRRNKSEIIVKLSGVLLFYLILFWLLIPKSVEIIATSTFDLWTFNQTSTFYLLINLCILIFITLTIKHLIQTAKK